MRINRSLSIAVYAGLLSLLTACGPETTPLAPGPDGTPGQEIIAPVTEVMGTMETEAGARSYRLHVPDGLDPSGPVGVSVALHGGGGNGANLQAHIGLDAVADREGFMVVYPDGNGRLGEVLLTWNAGNCCGYALDRRIDDVEYIRALMADLSTVYSIDAGQVYATGMSNGGMMSYRLACEASDLFAAFAPVAGALNIDCEPSEPVSVLALHGTIDQHVLFYGAVPAVRADTHERTDRSVHYAMMYWAARDGCSLEPIREQSGTVIDEIYPDCGEGLGVELLAIEGGAHAWPGSSKFSPRGDEPSQALDASQAIWEFFEAHPKP